MTPNVCFALLDAAVIAGRGDELVVDRMTHARLLELERTGGATTVAGRSALDGPVWAWPQR